MTDQERTALLAPLTTLQVGGPAARLVTVSDPRELVDVCLAAWADEEPWLVLGGGSNVVVSDDGFEGTVIRIATRGVEQLETGPDDAPGTVRVRVQAGEPWDDLVAYAVTNGLSGIEALSGIPGSSGASPVQNIGAYGQEVASVLAGVSFLDAETGELEWLSADDLGFGYRTSVLKRGRSGVVVSIDLRLGRAGTDALALGAPIEYDQLANALGVALGDRVALGAVREAVLRLRASKGMVLDPADPDSVSAGSFFTNPIVGEQFARTIPSEAPRWVTEQPATDDSPEVYSVKLSAAWLIEHAGLGRGFSLPGSNAAISGKHTLALVNRGGATASQIAELARFIQWRVQAEFGVNLAPEPVFVGSFE
ncbi:UDP-N-acetylenolpyruvoylglucosamine reductase [Subtercola boreus]|uniref:UDP-N-acetylenolpyruvoylglucosamine reductase n=1 Tax=Subtercola boreus TaxID=120213 RepID=A0A3E0VF28_9MICO|nr:UDP-N-acetylmuramate dehydrogenase [Subtercola boreus]RFA08255.1 UDP-N-acetylenolpyruvoylglucosamine reductase [Subtercola boreus]TQL54852.1 UDP-N-acetylmuramate dehydrogenase [Subtercola boreus]